MFFKICHYLSASLAPLFFLSCSSSDEPFSLTSRRNVKGEYIYRQDAEHFFSPPLPHHLPATSYPWDRAGNLQPITKEYFRCRGSALNPPLEEEGEGGKVKIYDCDGESSHGLPMRDGVEFVYPLLIELFNYLQEATGERVVITSGHRCPAHNRYVDPSKENLYSKHMVGGEVSFYVEGYEYRPHAVVELLKSFYAEEESRELSLFRRYEGGSTNVRTAPWYNKEIFIKLFEGDEGRDFDNSHPYPYIAIQLRYDRDRGEKVSYSWKEANSGYLRR